MSAMRSRKGSEVVGVKIQTQVELLDFRVSTDKFDLSVLDR